MCSKNCRQVNEIGSSFKTNWTFEWLKLKLTYNYFHTFLACEPCFSWLHSRHSLFRNMSWKRPSWVTYFKDTNGKGSDIRWVQTQNLGIRGMSLKPFCCHLFREGGDCQHPGSNSEQLDGKHNTSSVLCRLLNSVFYFCTHKRCQLSFAEALLGSILLVTALTAWSISQSWDSSPGPLIHILKTP